MKKVITFIIFYTAIFNFSYSQNNYTQLDSIILFYNSNDSIGKYYKYVYKAEDYIMKGNFEKAAETYEKAFTYHYCPIKLFFKRREICPSFYFLVDLFRQKTYYYGQKYKFFWTICFRTAYFFNSY